MLSELFGCWDAVRCIAAFIHPDWWGVLRLVAPAWAASIVPPPCAAPYAEALLTGGRATLDWLASQGCPHNPPDTLYGVLTRAGPSPPWAVVDRFLAYTAPEPARWSTGVQRAAAWGILRGPWRDAFLGARSASPVTHWFWCLPRWRRPHARWLVTEWERCPDMDALWYAALRLCGWAMALSVLLALTRQPRHVAVAAVGMDSALAVRLLPTLARMHSVACLRVALNFVQRAGVPGVPWHTVSAALRLGHRRVDVAEELGFVAVLIAHAASAPDNESVRDCILAAMESKRDPVALVVGLMQLGVPWHPDGALAACTHADDAALRWVLQRGLALPPNLASNCAMVCARPGHLMHILALLPVGSPEFLDAAAGAADVGRLDVLRWLHEHGHPFDDRVVRYASANGHRAVLRWLGHTPAGPWHDDKK